MYQVSNNLLQPVQLSNGKTLLSGATRKLEKVEQRERDLEARSIISIRKIQEPEAVKQPRETESAPATETVKTPSKEGKK